MMRRVTDTAAVLISLACSSSGHAAGSDSIQTKSLSVKNNSKLHKLLPFETQTLTLTLNCLNCLRHSRGKTGGGLGSQLFFAPCSIFPPSTLKQQSAVAPFSRFLPPHALTPVSSWSLEIVHCSSVLLRGVGSHVTSENHSTYGDA